ncbi:MAG: phosphoribosylamine--glycine ligase, partial [Hymenobacter sp.]|nr:phosphoribosylamine--glycine ligase [Hymenobacter sp.]
AQLIVVGPEAPLAAGITDFFAGSDIKVFGPTRSAARLESSKVWSKEFMRRHGVATAQAWPFRSDNVTAARVKAAELGGHVVVKYDGLAAGKGVYVCSSVAEAEQALTDLQAEFSGWFSFLLEEKLTGPEISIIGVTDGNRIRLLATSQDHKQLLAHDQGPNTGGMGAYCPVPFADDNVLAAIRTDIIDPTLLGLRNEQFDFNGFLYFGVMLTPQGPKLLEYNVRLGDPEAEVLLPALESSLLELIEATLDGNLAQTVVRQRPGCYVGVVLASGGYPAAQFPTGFPITGLETLPPGILAFHGATRRQPNGQLVTSGGRVLVLVGHGPELEDAVTHVYRAVESVGFQNVYIRGDIGQRPAPEVVFNQVR